MAKDSCPWSGTNPSDLGQVECGSMAAGALMQDPSLSREWVQGRQYGNMGGVERRVHGETRKSSKGHRGTTFRVPAVTNSQPPVGSTLTLSAVLGTSYPPSPLISEYYCPHFVDEETDSER